MKPVTSTYQSVNQYIRWVARFMSCSVNKVTATLDNKSEKSFN